MATEGDSMEAKGTLAPARGTSAQASLAFAGEVIRRPGVLMGLIATCMLALSSLMPDGATIFNLSEATVFLRNWMNRGVGIAFIVAGGLLLPLAWIELRPRRGQVEAHPLARTLLVAGIWTLPLLFALPVASTDAYLYLDQGWQITQGVDPYLTGLTEAGGPMAPHVSWIWAGTTAVYPPLALDFSALAVTLGRSHPYLSLVALHVLDLLVLWLGAWAVRRIAADLGRDVNKALWWYLNPIVIVSGVGGMHHELLMTTLTLLGLAAARTRLGLIGGTVLVALAAAVKQPAIFIMPALILATLPAVVAQGRGARMWGELAVRTVVAGIVGTFTFAAVSLMSGLGFGWLAAMWLPGRVFTLAPKTLLWEAAIWTWTQLGLLLPDGTYNALGFILAGAAMAWLVVEFVRRTPDRWPALLWIGPLAYCLMAPSLWPWYFIPVFAVFGLEQLDARAVRRRMAFVIGAAFLQAVIEYTGFAMYGSLTGGLICAILWLHLSRRYPAIPESLADPRTV